MLPWRVHGAVVDGELVADQPVLHLAEQGLDDARFEVMIGFAKDEWQFFRGHTPTLQETDPQTAEISVKPKGGSYRPLGSVAVNSAGYFNRTFKVNGASRSKYKVTIGGVSRVK